MRAMKSPTAERTIAETAMSKTTLSAKVTRRSTSEMRRTGFAFGFIAPLGFMAPLGFTRSSGGPAEASEAGRSGEASPARARTSLAMTTRGCYGPAAFAILVAFGLAGCGGGGDLQSKASNALAMVTEPGGLGADA